MSEGIHPIAASLPRSPRALQECRCNGRLRTRRAAAHLFANHTSHLDFVVLWSALPSEIRAYTRPIAAKDYWSETPLRHYLVENVFNAVLVERGAMPKAKSHEDAKFVSSLADRRHGRGTRRQNSLILFSGRHSGQRRKGRRIPRRGFTIWPCGGPTSSLFLHTWRT